MSLRFDQSRKNLAQALKQLEDAMQEKIREASLVATGDDNAEAKILEQNVTIECLNSEVNHLQNQLSDLGKEIEFLTESNKSLWKRVESFTQQKNDLVVAIEADLVLIREVIEKYDG